MTKEELIGIMRDSDPQEWLVCRNVHVRLVEFETLPGAIYLSKKGNYYIIINDRLAFPERQKTLLHEIKHLLDHIEAPGSTYWAMTFQPLNARLRSSHMKYSRKWRVYHEKIGTDYDIGVTVGRDRRSKQPGAQGCRSGVAFLRGQWRYGGLNAIYTNRYKKEGATLTHLIVNAARQGSRGHWES